MPRLRQVAKGDAPEIDGVVFIQGENLEPGQMVAGTITAAQEYDLVGIVSDQM